MTVNCILDNGISKVKQKRDMDCKFGQMDQNLRDFGKMIWQTDSVDSF